MKFPQKLYAVCKGIPNGENLPNIDLVYGSVTGTRSDAWPLAERASILSRKYLYSQGYRVVAVRIEWWHASAR